MSATRQWTWTILRLVILVFLITGVVEVIIVAGKTYVRTMQYWNPDLSEPISRRVRPPSQEGYSPYRRLADEPDLAAKVITYKRLYLDVDSTGVSATYDLYLPKDHRLFELVESGANSPGRLANEVFGAVTVERSDQFVKFERMETLISPSEDNAHIFVKSARFTPRDSSYRIHVRAKQLSLPLNIASKEVIVYTSDVYVVSGSPLLPVSKTPDQTIYIFPPQEDETVINVEVINPPSTPVRDPDASSLSDVLEYPVRIPGDRLWYGVLASLPFLLFLYWNRKRDSAATDEQSAQRVKAVKTYLVFHFTYFFFYGLNDLIGDWRDPFMKALSFVESRTLYVFAAHEQYESYLLVPMMAMFIYVWPTFVNDSKRDRRIGNLVWGSLAIGVLAGLFSFVVLAATANADTLFANDKLSANIGSLSVGSFYWLFFGLSALILYILCLLLATVQTHSPKLRFALSVFLLLSILIGAEILGYVVRYSDSPYSDHPYKKYYAAVTVVLFVLSTFLIVRAFAAIFYQAITGRDVNKDRRKWSWKKRLAIILVLLVVALSTPTWNWPMSYWQLWSLAWVVRVLFLTALVWILVDYLRRVSEESDWLNLPESAREAGILLALSMFYSPTTRWKYIPISFIVGYVVLRLWLLPEKQFDRSVFSQVKAGMITMIDRVIAFNDAERALKTLKKELLTKLGKGEIEPLLYTNKLQQQANTVNALKQELTLHKRFAKHLVLAFGPGDSAWENGKKVALYSLLFSIPWWLLYLRDLVKSPATFEGYLILDLLTRIILFVLPWLSYGFIFGYFYPHIRGHNGIQKGLVLFLTIVVPDLIWTALALPLDRENWLSFGFWVLQIFVHAMLLGMIAGDFAVMRANGFRWSQLLEFYRLSSLSAWASSVILALAAAASTLITSGATQIITTAFKYVSVTQEAPSPTPTPTPSPKTTPPK